MHNLKHLRAQFVCCAPKSHTADAGSSTCTRVEFARKHIHIFYIYIYKAYISSFLLPQTVQVASCPQLPVCLFFFAWRKSGCKNFSCFLQLIEFRVLLSGIAIKVHAVPAPYRARALGAATKCQTEPILQEFSPMTSGPLQAAGLIRLGCSAYVSDSIPVVQRSSKHNFRMHSSRFPFTLFHPSTPVQHAVVYCQYESFKLTFSNFFPLSQCKIFIAYPAGVRMRLRLLRIRVRVRAGGAGGGAGKPKSKSSCVLASTHI